VSEDHHHAKRWYCLRFQPDLNLKIRALNHIPSSPYYSKGMHTKYKLILPTLILGIVQRSHDPGKS
jgi:hypothetical protein